MSGQTADIAPADKKDLRFTRRDRYGSVYSADSGLDHVEETRGGTGRPSFGRKDRFRGVYAGIA